MFLVKGLFLSTIVAGLALADTTPNVSTDENVFGRANLEARSGSSTTGIVEFARSDKGIEVRASVSGATPGKHGFHVHEKGDCSSADASSAGEHYNPLGHKHGGMSSTNRHVGDFGNLEVDENGNGTYRAFLSTPKGKKFSWDSFVGKSVIVHASADDLKTQPSGNSGDRVACGVIEKVVKAPLAE